MKKSLQSRMPVPSGWGLRMLLALFCAVTVGAAFAQNGVKGRVSDEKGEPVIGASILVKGSIRGVSTDAAGGFTVDVPPDGTLEVMYVGYLSQEIAVAGRSFIEVKLVPDVQTIEDVVVVGYGTQKKVNLTGAVGAVKMDEQIASRSVPNVSSALSGLIPGLAVNVNTGMAGKNNATLLVRGLGSVNKAAPLVVVDGMPDVDINRLNMNDIESISVLKDASSAAVYGSRAANGVVLITTKSGSKADGKATISFTGSYAMSEPIKMIDLMPNYPYNVAAMIKASAAGGGTSRFRFGAVEEWAAMSRLDPLRYPNTDWMDITTRTGQLQNYSLSASGGNDRSSFYISGGIMDENGLQIGNDYTRYTTRFNYHYKVRKNISVGARFSGSWSKWKYSATDGFYTNSASGGLIGAIGGVTPYDPETGRYGGAMMYGEDATIYNPYREYRTMHNENDAQHMFASANAEWEPLKGLKIGVDYNLTYQNQLTKKYNDPHSDWNFQTGKPNRVLIGNNAGVDDANTMNYRTLLNSRLTYNRSFGKHDVGALFVYSEEYAFSRNLSGGRNSRLHPSLTEINATLNDVVRAGGSSGSWGLRSYIGRLNYAYDDRYLLEMNFRYDGSSKFVSGYQYGFFPSASLGWRFTEEKFLKFLNRVLTSGKIRLSYGGLGNNDGVGNFEQQETLAAAHYTVGGQVAMGLVNKKMINQTLSWETTNVFNAGLDLGFLNNQLTAEMDYYNRRTTGMLRPDELSSMLTGAYSAPKKNIGILRNQGVEVNLTWRDRIKEFQYSVNFNASYNANKLERWNSYLGQGNVFLGMPYQYIYTQVNRGGVIQTWQEIYDAPWASNGSAPGDMLLEDLNGDGYVNGEDKKAMPHALQARPTANFGLNLSASWKGIDFAMLWSATAGRKNYWNNHFNNVTLMAGAQALTWTQYADSWSYDNRNATLPRLVTGARGLNKAASTYWLDDMSYIRLKNVQIGYSLPDKWLKRFGIGTVRIYVSGENLWTITSYRGLDPEKALTGGGSENDAYPMLRTIAFGINIVI